MPDTDPIKEKKLDLFDYLKSINQTKTNLMRGSDDPKAVSGYPAFIARRMLSYHKDAIFIANEINCFRSLDNQMQYEFFLNALSKKSRFAKIPKRESDETIELLMRFYGYSEEKALALPPHTEEQLAIMKQRLSDGGVIKQKPV